MIMTKKEIKDIFKVLEQFKAYIGLADYYIKLNADYQDLNSNLATISVNGYEKEMELTLSIDFKNLSVDKQRNVLIHELVHGRICLYKQRLDKLASLEEEDLANDLTRGLELIKNK